MHPLLLPLALLFLAITRGKAAAPAQAGPKPTPPPGGITRAKLREAVVKTVAKKLKQRAAAAKPITAKPLRGDPFVTVDHPNVLPSEAERQAAVDAAVSHAIREDTQAPPTAAPVDSKAKAAAQKLLMFLIKTGRFGGGKDKPAEVKAAQKDLGVKPDGIVGPKTRTAALNQGVALPPKP
jgi:peptidoglycan hydrolase-like protein with peptidoglycan-binding domain